MKKIILFTIFILVFAGFGAFIISRRHLAKEVLPLPAHTGARSSISDSDMLPAPSPAHSASSGQAPAPSLQQKTLPQESLTELSPTTNVYKNAYYGIELSYPSAFGDVVAQRDEFFALPISDDSKECKDRGQFFHKGFSKNSNLDFGLITAKYKNCSARSHSIFDANKVSISGNTLTLEFWNSDPVHVAVEKVVQLPNSKGIAGYIIKNSIGGAHNEPAAVVPTPGNNLGPLVFRISNENTSSTVSYEQGVNILEQIISR